MLVLLVALVILLYTLQSLFTRFYTDHYPGDKSLTTPVFAVVCGLIVTAVSFIFSGFKFSCGWETVLLGILNAVVLYGYDSFIIKGSATGSYSILMTFSITGGIMLPAFSSWIFFNGVFTWVQIISILIIFSAVFMISKKDEDEENKEEYKKHRKLFLIVCAFLGLANGMYGVLLDAQQQLTGPEQKEEMVVVTFLGAALISIVQIIAKEKKNALSAFRQTKLSLTFLLVTSLISACAINVLVLALEGIDTTIVYTFDNAGVLLLSALASAVFFKEKLSKLNIIGCIIMAVGLACMTQHVNIQNWIVGLFA